MPKIQKAFMLTDQGYKDLKGAIAACTLTNFSMMIPFGVSIQIIIELLAPLSGQEISWGKLWTLFTFGVIGVIIIFLCSRNDYKKTYVVSYKEAENTRIALGEHIRKLPMSLFNSKDLSELTTNLMGDVANSEHCLSHLVPQLVANFISITVITVILAFFDWRMAAAMFISVPVAFAIVIWSRQIYGKLHQKHNDSKLAAAGQAQEYIEGIKVIHACNLDGEKFSALEKALRTMTKAAIQTEFGTGIFITGAQTILQAGIGLTVLIGAQLLADGQIGLISVLMFLLMAARIYGPFLAQLTLLPELFYHQIGVARLRTLMAIKPMEGDKQKKIPSSEIVFENVDFSYNAESGQTISNMSITIPKGGITALVGPSGSGKSTVSRLIARFWDTDRGSVSVGGIDIKKLDPEHLMSLMSFVFQDVVLFNDTIYNNIKIGNRNAAKEQVLAAAKAARCDEFVTRLPHGYHTMLGENGATLSGGERQRLSIARALLKDAPIVLLDEATASLDPESEASIQKAIAALIQGKTVVVIAHRLRTIADADQIIVMERGCVVEQGKHKELMEQNGLYNRLYTIQQESLGWSVGV